MVGNEKKLECLSLASLKPFELNLVVEDFLVPAPIFLQQRWLGMKTARVFVSGKPKTLRT